MKASLILRPSDRSGERNDINAEMLVEAPVLGGQRGFDHKVRDLIERHRIVAQKAALADLVVETVEEGDAVIVSKIHLALGDFERWDGEGHYDGHGAGAKR